MSTIRPWLVTLVIAVFALAVPSVVDACPYCKSSPSGWGFCRYGAYSGFRTCKEIVVDSWSGRTDCELTGYCSWRGDNDDGDSCGYTDIYGNCLI